MPFGTTDITPGSHSDLEVAIGEMLAKLDRISDRLGALLTAAEPVEEYDQTFVAGGSAVGAGDVINLQIPRTFNYVQLEVVPNGGVVALFSGNLPGSQCAAALNPEGQSGAILMASAKVEARDYLDGSGYLTVYFPNAGAIWANVRIRSLDRKFTRYAR